MFQMLLELLSLGVFARVTFLRFFVSSLSFDLLRWKLMSIVFCSEVERQCFDVLCSSMKMPGLGLLRQ